MKNLIAIIITTLILSSCITTKHLKLHDDAEEVITSAGSIIWGIKLFPPDIQRHGQIIVTRDGGPVMVVDEGFGARVR